MSTDTRLFTAEDLWRMGGDQRRELVRGELRTMAPAGFDHGAISNNLAFLLTKHVREHKLGGVVCTAETGYVLARDPDVVRAADASYVRADRIPPAGRTIKFFEGPPDLAVEVTSPSDSNDEVDEKVDDYLESGTRLVWVVSARRRTITIYAPNRAKQVLHENDTLTGEDVIPGFQCKVADVFL